MYHNAGPAVTMFLLNYILLLKIACLAKQWRWWAGVPSLYEMSGLQVEFPKCM